MTLTRRDFLAASGSALAATAVALAWPPARAGGATGAAPGAASGALRGPDGALRSSAIERQLRFRAGALRPAAWSRGGGAYRVSLCDAERVEIATPHRGRVRVSIADPRARDAIARELSPGVLREVIAEAARLRAGAA